MTLTFAEWVLRSLCAAGPDQWRIDPRRRGVWHAICPCCGDERRTLLIYEDDAAGTSALFCSNGCPTSAVLDVLAAIDTEATLKELRREPPPKPRQIRPATVIPFPSVPADDPLKRIPAHEWLPALSGEEIIRNKARCPLPDHDDRTPSMQVYEDRVWCFGCQRGGDIIAVAGLVYGLEPRGRGYWEIRRRLAGDLLRSIGAVA